MTTQPNESWVKLFERVIPSLIFLLHPALYLTRFSLTYCYESPETDSTAEVPNH